MNNISISNDFLEIIAGTTNKLHPVYMEASKSIDNNTPKAMGYIKNFINSIERVANKESVKDTRISETKGNIKNLSSYEDIKTSMEFLKKNLGGVKVINDLHSIFSSLEKYQAQYTEGYEKNIRLVVLEYESAVDMLITGLTLTMADQIDVVQNGTAIKIQKNNNSMNGVIYKTIADLSTQMSAKNHKQYLDEMIKSKEYAKVDTSIKESTLITEAAVADTLELIDVMITSVGKIGHYTANIVRTIKNSLFGILPLIRSCLYIRYKKKADTVLALEQQVEFINQNIEQLQNRTNIPEDEKKRIIKKQQATVEAYKKKAAKLRAQLTDTEKQASEAIKKEDPAIKNTNDDDFVLENAGFKSSFLLNNSTMSFSDFLEKIDKEEEDDVDEEEDKEEKDNKSDKED